MPSHRATSASVLLASALLLGALTGCTAPGPVPVPDPTPTSLSVTEAELFSATRFRNFDLGVRAVTLTLEDAAGEITVHGYVDFPAGLVYGAAANAGAPIGLVRASHEELSIREAEAPAAAPLPAPSDGWRSQPFDPASSPLANALAVLLSLGQDRPENTQLLRQSDAAALGTEKIETAEGPVEAHVFIGPSATGGAAQPAGDRARYWVGDDGVLLRVEVPAAGDRAPMTFAFSHADDVELTLAPPVG